jgi:hypothetical protein
MKLEISLFRFDHKSDYLPYYTKHFLTIEKEQTLRDIFNTINDDQPFSYENSDTFVVAVNGVYTHLNISIQELKAHFGKDLTIEPMSIRRSHSDFLINEEDFEQRFDVLNAFTNLNKEESKTLYESYKIYFYASNTLNYEINYIGDAALLLAHDLIEKYPHEEKAILEVLNDHSYGLPYHTRLDGRVYNLAQTIEQKIQSLKDKLSLSKEEQNFKVNTKSNMNFGEFEKKQEVKHDFNGFTLAYYEGITPCSQTKELLASTNAKVLDMQSFKQDLALDTFHINPDLTYKLVSSVMLDAFDQNADLLVVDSDELFYLFDYNRKELKRVAGREVLIPILHKNEFVKLMNGSHISVQESLGKHCINPELI